MDRKRQDRKNDERRRERREERKRYKTRSRSSSRNRSGREGSREKKRSRECSEERRLARGREKLSVLAKLGIKLAVPERGAQKLQWSKSTGNNWEATKFGNGEVTAKFQRLMGMKSAAPEAAGEEDLERQEELFRRMESEYEAARQATHSLRRAGFGFTNPSYSLTGAGVKMEEPPQQDRVRKGFLHTLKKGLLPIMTVVCTFSAVVVGLILRARADNKPWKPRDVMYMQFPGELFLSMLKMLIIPLMVSSITAAVGALDLSLSKKIGTRAILYYAASTGTAVVEGIILVSLIHPGNPDIVGAPREPQASSNSTTTDTILDLVRNMFPANLVQSCISQYRTTLSPPKLPNGTLDTSASLEDWNIKGSYEGGSNVLGLVIFSIVQGIAIGRLGKMGKPLQDFYEALAEVSMVITKWVIWLSPIGVFFLVVAKILETESFSAMVGQLGMYFITVILGLTIHGLFVLPMMYFICVRKLPLKFIANMGQAAITAFATGSSSASLSVSMQCLEEKNKVDVRISRFVMPIGATVNMDGTALYEAVAVIFISQIRQMSLSIGQLFAVSIASTLASIGAAAIPQAGLVTMVMVLETVNLKADDVTLIYAVDWLLDRFRTTVNVIGDAYGAGIVEHLSRKELEKLPPVATQKN